MRLTASQTKELYDEVSRYIASGHSVKEAAIEFARSPAAIYAILRRNGTKKGAIRDDRFSEPEPRFEALIEHNEQVELQAKAVKALTPSSPYMKFKDIAAELGLSTEIAIYHYTQAMKKIAKYLKDNPEVADQWAAYMIEDANTDEWDLPYGTINQYRW